MGLGIEGSLKQQLINDVEDYPGSLPLLQYTLTELWHEARKQGEQFLRLETYTKLGGIEGTLEKRADEVYENLGLVRLLPLITLLHKSGSLRSPRGLYVLTFLFLLDYQKVAKRIFLELTQVGETMDTRRRVMLGDLVNSKHSLEILDQVTQELANEKNRLITRTEAEKDEDTDQSKIQNLKSKIQIDVVHEALIRHWKKLGDWKQQYQAAMVIERKIEALAHDWEEKGKKSGDLLQGSRLGEAEEYLKSFSELGMLDGMAEEYVKVSQTHRRRVRRNLLAVGIVGSTVLISLTVSSVIFGLQSQRQALNAQLQTEVTNIKYGLSVEPKPEELIQAIKTTAQSQAKQKFL